MADKWADGGETGQRDTDGWFEHGPNEGFRDAVGYIGVGEFDQGYEADYADDADATRVVRSRMSCRYGGGE